MRIEYVQIERPYQFVSPFGGDEFALLLYSGDETITPQEQHSISDEIVRQGCRYAVCAGYACSSWDDSIDMSDLERNDWEVNEDNFIMTTWHEKEALEDVVFFFRHCTCIDDCPPERFLVLVIGNRPDVAAEIEREMAKPLD